MVSELLAALWEVRSPPGFVYGLALSATVAEKIEAEVRMVKNESPPLDPQGTSGLFSGIPFVVDPRLAPSAVDVIVTREAWAKRLEEIAAIT